MMNFSIYPDSFYSELLEKCNSAEVYRGINLTSLRGGVKADIILHRSGVYVIVMVDEDGTLYADDNNDQWKVRDFDGNMHYIENYSRVARENAKILSTKCKEMMPFIKPVLVFSDRTCVAEKQIAEEVIAQSIELFISNMMIDEYAARVIPAEIMPTFRKQLDFLKMVSK